MTNLFKLRRNRKSMYYVGAYCSFCQKWYTIEECRKGKGGILLCPLCHSKVRRNRRGK